MDEALDRFVGEWDVEMRADGDVVALERVVYEWIADGDFLLTRSETQLTDAAPQVWRDNAPTSSTVVIGADDYSGGYGFLYADSRGVKRVYEMSIDGDETRVWGESGPSFFQRYVGTFSADGKRIEGRWERSTHNENWELDFESTYVRR
jgi:hypothetical protein